MKKIFYGLAILVGIVLTGFFSIQESFAEEKTWWLGENLKQGDYFEYSLCEIDLNDCLPINLKIWIKGTIPYESETLWDTKVVVIDGNKIIKGSMSLGKIASEPITFDDDLFIYAITFGSTVAWLASYAPGGEASRWYNGSQSLNEGSEWGRMGAIGGLSIYVVGSETIKTPAGVFDSILVGWDIDETENKFWIVDEFPFPIKADVWLHTKQDVPYQWFKFELLDYREDVLEDPFQPVAYADDSLEQESEFIESPKQQMKTGILPSEVQCKEGLELIFKLSDGSPACVKPETAEKLIQRGWMMTFDNDIIETESNLSDVELLGLPKNYEECIGLWGIVEESSRNTLKNDVYCVFLVSEIQNSITFNQCISQGGGMMYAEGSDSPSHRICSMYYYESEEKRIN